MSKRSNGEGSIGKRKNGTWYGAIRIEGKQQWVYGDTRKEVVDKIKQLQQKHEQGINLDVKGITITVFLRKWLEDSVKDKRRYKTFKTYTQIVDNYIIPAIGTHTLTALRPDHVQAMINKLAKEGKAVNTIKNARAVLRRALNQAIKWRYITFNAATAVELPQGEQHKITPLTKLEAQQFLASVKGHRLEALYLMTLLLGLREGEVLGLQLHNLDLDNGTVQVDGSLQWQDSKLVRTTTKTKSSIRTLPIPPSLIPLLKKHLEIQQAKFPCNTYVFASTRGTPINPRNLVRQFKDLLEKAALRDLRFHDLRHSCATFLIARGEHPRTVMEILGHSQISTTMNTYGHVLQEVKHTAIAGIDRYLASE
jgi:integrase